MIGSFSVKEEGGRGRRLGWKWKWEKVEGGSGAEAGGDGGGGGGGWERTCCLAVSYVESMSRK